MRHMVVIVPELTGYASIRHVAVSLPYAAQLIDGVKYMEPGGLKPPEGGTERRRQRAPRAPSMRYFVKLAVKCDSAEQLGKKLRRCYQRQQQRQGWPGLAMAATRARSPRSLTDCSRTTDAARNRRKMKTDEHARFAYQRLRDSGICRRTPSRPRNDHRQRHH
jgi:hypothetical protein